MIGLYEHMGNFHYQVLLFDRDWETKNYVDIYAGEGLTFHVMCNNANYRIANHQIEFGGKYTHRGNTQPRFPQTDAGYITSGSDTWTVYNRSSQSLDLVNYDPNTYSSQQGWFNYIDTKEGMYSTSFHNYQDEFYNGEYSGSTLTYYPKNWNCHHQPGGASRYNPYRIYHVASQSFSQSLYGRVEHPATASWTFDANTYPYNTDHTMSFTASQNSKNEAMTSSHKVRIIFRNNARS